MIDYLMDGDDDLQTANGDFVRGNSNKQHQRSLLIALKGDYKQNPLCAVGLPDFLLDDNTSDMLREIRLRFIADGIKIQQLGFIGTKINVVGDYGS